MGPHYMSENILVVEYEPRYTERVRQALAGHALTPTFAKDGDEAIRALDGAQPKLIVLSSVVPKVSTSELIRAIRGRAPLQSTPILLTVSGYNGKSPKADAQRVGASDILPKPYSEVEFLGKVQQMLGVVPASAAAEPAAKPAEAEDDALKPRRKSTADATGDVDKMLADTLAGVMPQRKTQAGGQPVPRPASAPAANDLDKRLQDTLSGLEKSARKTTTAGATPRPAVPSPAPAPPAAPAVAKPATPAAAPAPAPRAEMPDRVVASQPVIQQRPVVEPVVEEDEPTDGTKFGQYVLVEKIATGGMAEVWKARMRGVEGFQKIVAIKKILPHLSDNQEFIEMFVDEAKLAAQLNHNNIIHIYDLGKIQNSYYIAMEYIDGFDLKTILRRGEERGNPLNVELALFIASKVAAALDYAHRKKDFEDREMGLVHRDVSPQNVLISEEGDIKLCDFGIAKAASKASHTQAGALKGKLQYMAPEQAWGKHIDRRSDIFALATVLFEMLTARKLFTGDNEISILEQVREARVQPPSLYNDEVTPDIDRIVLKALQKDPENRYQTAGEMAREIDAVLYTFRPTPTSADLAIYMHRLSAPEPAVPVSEHETEAPARAHVAPAPNVMSPSNVIAPAVIPAVIPAPVAAPEPTPAPAPAIVERPEPAAPMFGAVPEPVQRKSPIGIIAAAVVGLAIVGGGAWFMMRKPEPAATPAPAAPVANASTATVPLAAAPTTTDTSATAAGLIPPTTTAPAIDPNAVDAEVQKRMAAERARLEALARAQQAAAPQTATAAPRPAAPAPAPATTTQAPQVAQQTPPPATATQPAATPDPAPAQQNPAPAQPAVQRAREGELIATGTPGLVPPRLVRRGSVTYPPMARAQKVEGTVITSVLVSESGSVLDVKILRGPSRAAGLTEAAEQAMRRSSFAPGMKDGVRVKSWITVPVEFKL
jgi:TonB family protein